MHRVLKEEATIPSEKSMKLQQRRFDKFRWEYNHQRPHEGIDMQFPIDLFGFSDKRFPNELQQFSYPPVMETRKVNRDGGFRWHSKWIFLSKALSEERIGWLERKPFIWSIFVGPLEIGRLEETDFSIHSLTSK